MEINETNEPANIITKQQNKGKRKKRKRKLKKKNNY